MTDEQRWMKSADLPRTRDLVDAQIGRRGESRAPLAVSMWVFPRRKHCINATGMVRDAAYTYSLQDEAATQRVNFRIQCPCSQEDRDEYTHQASRAHPSARIRLRPRGHHSRWP